MACGAILYFDDETDAAIRGLWQAIEDAGLPSTLLGQDYPPHLTLAACDDLHLDELRKFLPLFVAENPPMTVDFNGVGVFDGNEMVVYQSITPTRALLGFHARFWNLAGPYLHGPSGYYRPEHWVPHVTLNRELSRGQTGAVVEALLRVPLPQRGLLKELVLVGFDQEQPRFNEMFKARLGRYL